MRYLNGKVIRLLAALIILLLASAADALSNSGGGSWWYYRDLTISNTGSDLTDYQVLISLNSDNFPLNAQTNGADIRFTDAGGAELSYWIESWDYAGRNAKIWVNVTSIPASGSTSIRMYYGNPSAISASNGATTFYLFDDFSGITINSNLWTTELVNVASLSQSGGELTMTVPSSYGSRADVKSTSNYSIPYRLRFRMKLSGYGDHFTYVYDGASDLTSTWASEMDGPNYIMFRLDSGGDSDLVYNAANATAGNWTVTYVSTGTANVYSIFEIMATTAEVKFVVDGNVKATHTNTTNIPTIALPLHFRALTWISTPWQPSGVTKWIDYVFLAKYASSEPSVSIGSEETYGLVGYWHFDEGTGNATADSSGNGNNGTLYNFNWDANSNWVEGKFGKALSFDGSNDYVGTGLNNLPSGNAARTLEAWVYPTLSGEKYVISYGNPTVDNQEFNMYIENNMVALGLNGGGWSSVETPVTLNEWQHLVVAYDGSTPKFYRNGVELTTGAGSGSPNTVLTSAKIGVRISGSNNEWKGIIDDVRIYNRTLSAEEINAHYEQGAGALMGNSIGYSAIVATGQITSVVATNGSFGLIPKSQTKTINNSVTLNNIGDISAKVEARFNDSVASIFGLISGANVLNATNFALGLPSVLVPLNNSGADVQVAVAPPGVTALDARLSVSNEQAAGDYSGTVVLTFSNDV